MHFIWMSSLVFCLASVAAANEPLFSGPQVGEPLVPFEATFVFGEDAGRDVDVLESIKDAPTLLVFVHQITRPSIALTRLVIDYASTKDEDGLHSRLIFLSKDPTETEAWFRRARHALPKGVSPMISIDGMEGPGAYGLNRKMTLTVLVAREGKVVANFPLIQPSVQADAAKVGQAIEKALGRDLTPTLSEMGFTERNMPKRGPAQSPEYDGIYRQKMSPVIQKTATPEEVAAAATEVEQFAAKNPWFKQRVHKASNLIVGGGKLSNYGTAPAQEYLKKWAKEFASEEMNDATKPGRNKAGSAEAESP